MGLSQPPNKIEVVVLLPALPLSPGKSSELAMSSRPLPTIDAPRVDSFKFLQASDSSPSFNSYLQNKVLTLAHLLVNVWPHHFVCENSNDWTGRVYPALYGRALKRYFCSITHREMRVRPFYSFAHAHYQLNDKNNQLA